MDSLMQSGNNVLVRNYLNNLLDALCKAYEFPVFSLKFQDKVSGRQRARKMSYDQAISQLEQMEVRLQRTNEMLRDLQDEFDQQLAESKVTALTKFFSQLNSDRYGNILDMVLQLRKGVTHLSRAGYELPEELKGLFVVYNKLVQFIRDSHIDPIRKPNPTSLLPSVFLADDSPFLLCTAGAPTAQFGFASAPVRSTVLAHACACRGDPPSPIRLSPCISASMCEPGFG